MIALDSANQVFGQRDYPWEEPFLDALAASYGAGLREVDFETGDRAGPHGDQRLDRRADPRPDPGDRPGGRAGRRTRMVLVNALYFKAPWSEPFEESLTSDQPFHLASGESASCR